MRRRPAVTLLEVLIALFIMAIGMLALLVLFPLGAFSMGKALKDDRCASAAAMAEQVAICNNLRHDGRLEGNTIQTNLYLTRTYPSTSQSLAAPYNGPSLPVYVDPYGYNAGVFLLGCAANNKLIAGITPIQRINPNFSINQATFVDRWFSLPNDISFLTTGTPDLVSTSVDRGRRYTWAYMVRRPQALADQTVDLTVVVYYNRPTGVAQWETVFEVANTNTKPPTAKDPTQGDSSIVLNSATAASFRRGMWLLDITPITGTGANGVPAVPRSDFYRITNVDDIGGGQVVIDVQPNLICDGDPNGTAVSHVVLMDYVAEVFPKGTSWQP